MRCAGTFSKWVGSLVPYAAPVPGEPDASINVICASGLVRRRCTAASTPAAPPPTIATRIMAEGYLSRESYLGRSGGCTGWYWALWAGGAPEKKGPRPTAGVRRGVGI